MGGMKEKPEQPEGQLYQCPDWVKCTLDCYCKTPHPVSRGCFHAGAPKKKCPLCRPVEPVKLPERYEFCSPTMIYNQPTNTYYPVSEPTPEPEMGIRLTRINPAPETLEENMWPNAYWREIACEQLKADEAEANRQHRAKKEKLNRYNDLLFDSLSDAGDEIDRLNEKMAEKDKEIAKLEQQRKNTAMAVVLAQEYIEEKTNHVARLESQLALSRKKVVGEVRTIFMRYELDGRICLSLSNFEAVLAKIERESHA